MSECTFRLPRRYFTESVRNAQGAVAKRSPKPALRMIRLECADGVVSVCGWDCEQAVLTDDGSCSAEGAAVVLVDPKDLLGAMKSSKDAHVAVSIRDTLLAVDGVTLPCLSADEYPMPPAIGKPETNFAVSGAQLHDAIKACLCAMDETATRYALGGICFRLRDEGIELAATDSRRLAFVPLPAQFGKRKEKLDSVVVPAATMRRLAQNCDSGTDVLVSIVDNAIQFQMVSADYKLTFWTRLMEGRFPKYEDCIPQKGDICSVNRELLRAACQRASLVFPTRGDPACRTLWTFGKGKIGYHAKSDEGKSAEGELPYSDPLPKSVAIELDCRYLLEWLDSLPKDLKTVRAQVYSKYDAVLLGTGLYSYVVMPLSPEKEPKDKK